MHRHAVRTQQGLGEQQSGGTLEAGEGGHLGAEAAEGGRSSFTVDEALRGLLDRGVDWDAMVSEVLWSCKVRLTPLPLA